MTRFSRNNSGNIDPASVATGGAMTPVSCFYFPFLRLLPGSRLPTVSARTGVEIPWKISWKFHDGIGISKSNMKINDRIRTSRNQQTTINRGRDRIMGHIVTRMATTNPLVSLPVELFSNILKNIWTGVTWADWILLS